MGVCSNGCWQVFKTKGKMITDSKIKKGKAAEMIVKARALLRSIEVFESSSEDTKADIILKYDNKLFKCQIKCIGNSGSFQTRKISHSKTQHKVHKYTCSEIDYFIAVDLINFNIYFIDCVMLQTIKSSMALTVLNRLILPNKFPFMEPHYRNIVSGHDDIGESFGNANAEGMGNTQPVETR